MYTIRGATRLPAMQLFVITDRSAVDTVTLKAQFDMIALLNSQHQSTLCKGRQSFYLSFIQRLSVYYHTTKTAGMQPFITRF